MAVDFSQGLTKAELTSIVAQLLDFTIGNSTTDDITPDVLDSFIKEGFQRIVTMESAWPWYQATYTFPTIENQRSYTNFVLTAANGVDTVPANVTLSEIYEISAAVNTTDSGNQLIYMDQTKCEQVWPPNSDNDTPDIPQYFSYWAGQLNLWPKPDDAYQITIRGYRYPSYAWMNDAEAIIDIDTEFHLVLINFVLAKIYDYQEDPEMSAVYMRNFETGATLAKGLVTAPNANQPMIMSGGLQLYPFGWYRYMANLSVRAVATGEWG
jgi:hypothetical protein